MNRAKRNEAIKLLTELNKNYQEQINNSSDKALIDSLIKKIVENEQNLKILENSSNDFSNVKSLKDLKNVKPKPREWD